MKRFDSNRCNYNNGKLFFLVQFLLIEAICQFTPKSNKDFITPVTEIKVQDINTSN